MKKVKLMISAGRLDLFKEKREINKVRYQAYVDEFGEDNFGIVQISDIEKEMNLFWEVPVYSLNKNLDFF